MIPAIYNWQPCRVCGLPVPAGEAAHRECSERVRLDEPGELAAHLADAEDVDETCSRCGDELLTDYEHETGMCAFCDHAADFYGAREGGAGR